MQAEKDTAYQQAKLKEFGPAEGDTDIYEHCGTKVSDEQVNVVMDLAKRAKIVPAKFAELLANYRAKSVPQLTVTQAVELCKSLQARMNSSATSQKSNDKQADPDGPATPEQVARLKDLAQRTGWPKKDQESFLSGYGVNSFRSFRFDVFQ